jgi:hypothetical protein
MPGAQPIPERHDQDRDGARRMTRRLRLLVPRATEPDAATWQAMGQALLRGDPLADEVALWMLDQGGARAWPLVAQAMRQSVDGPAVDGPAVADARTPPALAALLAHVARPPAWVRDDRADEGARALQSTGLHGMRVLRDAGLMAGYQASGINQTLLHTGALHEGAQRRVASTTAWWLAVTQAGGMKPGAEGWQMTLKVRLMHAMVRQRLLRGEAWSTAKWGLPVNQLDMQATYLAFSAVHLLSLQTTGMWLSRSQREAVMHLWRLIGWHMGVEEGLLCEGERAGRQALLHNLLSQAPPDEGSVKLARALMDEPLGRHYSGPLARWMGPVNKARHLSLVRWFVGAEGMRGLGLPATVPWYPLLCLLPLGLRSLVLGLSPTLRGLVTARARRAQLAYLRVLQGEPAGHASAERAQRAG